MHKYNKQTLFWKLEELGAALTNPDSDMANAEWNQIFRSFSTDELLAHRASLISQISIFSQQAVGTKSFTRDLGELRAQLSSAVYVLAERSHSKQTEGITDFSCLPLTGGS